MLNAFHLGSLVIKSYWVMVGLAIIIGYILFYFEARRIGLAKKKIISFYILGTLSLLISARLFYIIVTGPIEPAKIFSFSEIYWKGGISLYGVILGGLLFTLWFSQRNKFAFWKIADAVTPSIIFGITLMRLGCFLNGCCYGKPAELPWAVTFSNPLIYAPRGIPLHPVQLYEAGGNLILFFYFWINPVRNSRGVFRSSRELFQAVTHAADPVRDKISNGAERRGIISDGIKRKKLRFEGELSLKYAFAYNILRIIVEFFKHPVYKYKNSIFSSSQIIALFFLIFFSIVFKIVKHKSQLKTKTA